MESFEKDENGKCSKFSLVDKDEHTTWIGSLTTPKKQPWKLSVGQAISCLCLFRVDMLCNSSVTSDTLMADASGYTPAIYATVPDLSDQVSLSTNR